MRRVKSLGREDAERSKGNGIDAKGRINKGEVRPGGGNTSCAWKTLAWDLGACRIGRKPRRSLLQEPR